MTVLITSSLTCYTILPKYQFSGYLEAYSNKYKICNLKMEKVSNPVYK